ncbi:trichohyalin isoform X4 [Anguilla anguilla]|uniref:trichohyalin isoform X4 n=1 Tax=Anguilla anguilla TaxID=7936 RepID=UPI0015AE56B7|nr:trichohyalin isoform X4 [Anguilla anguilla]
MDPPPSPLARVRQVFWAVLNYVTAAVQQYLTPEPVTGNGDTLTGQEATVSVTTETQKWTEDDKHERANNEAKKKMREDRENVADACDSGCEHATTQEQCMISIATETNRKTDQYVVKDIKVRVTENVIEIREIVGNEPTTHIEKEAKGSQFTDEREMERYGTISKHVVQTVHMSGPSYFEERGRRGQGNTNEDYYQDKSDGEQKPTRREEKTKDKESGKLFSDGEEQTETNNRDRGREEHRAGLVKTGEMKIIRGAEEENEDLRELMEEVVQIMVEDDEMDIKTKDLRSKEGTKQKMQPKGNGEDRGKEFKLQLVSGAIGVGDENIKTVEIGRQGGVKEAHAIKEKPKEKTEMVTSLTVSGKGELDNKDIGSDRDIMNSGGGKDKERYEEKEGTRKLLIEEQYGEVSGTEEGKKDDVEELASAVESGGTEITHVERGEEKTHACDIKGDKSTGSQKAGQIAKAFNTRGEESGTERERGAENLKDKKTRTEFEGMEREGSQQKTDDDIKNKSECKGRKLETNWDEVGTILIEGAETGDEVNKAPVQEERMELTGAPTGGEESEKYESETEIETGVKTENYVDGWKDVPTKEQKMHKSERGKNGNGAVGRQIEMTDVDGDFKKNELCQTEVAVGNKENEMESIGLRNIETENRELKEIAEECGVVAEEEESKNSMAKGQEEETKTMIEEKQEHERHLIKENKEEPLVGQRDIGHNLDPAVEIEAGAVDEEGDYEGKNDGEEESLIIKEKIEWEHTKEVGKSGYTEEMEANKWGIEEKGEGIPVGRNDKEVRPEPMVPVPVERNDKGVLSEESHSGVERDIFTKETETDTDADEKDVGILSTGEDERITDIGRNENNFRDTIVENKEEQRESEACSEAKDMESVEMRKTETEEKDINKEKDIKDDEGISVEEQRQEGQFSEIMTEGKQRDMGNDFDSTGETETGAVDEEVDDEVGKEGEECMILKEGTGGKNTKEFGESEYSGEIEADVWGTEEKRDEKEVRPELMVPVPVERNDKGVLSEESHSGVERDIFTKETETDTDADEKDVGILSTGEDERITDMGRNENNFRDTIVENKEEQRESEACSEDKDMESVEMRKTETEEKDINKEKDIKDDEGISVEEQRQEGQFSEIMTEGKQRDMGNDFDSTEETETGAVDEEVDDEVGKEGEEECMILKEGTGGKNTKEFGESEYGGEIEADVWGTEEKRDEKEVRPEPMVPVPVERNDKGVLSEESHSGVERDIFTKETETDTDADEKDVGILSTGEDERITDIGRNDSNLREMIVENKEEEQREGEVCGEDKDMNSVEEKDIYKSAGEIEREKSVAETGNIETVWQEVEIREEMEDEKDIKAPVEEVCHKGSLEQLVLEEGDELIREEWKEDIQREKRGGSSNGVQVNVILDGDKQERKVDEGMRVEAQGQFSELITERKQEIRKDLDPTVEIEGGAVDEEEDAKEEKEKEEEGMILKEETGEKKTKEFGESAYSGEMEASVWGTEEKGDEIEGRPDEVRKVLIGNREIHDTFGIEVAGDNEKAELKGQEVESKEPERNSEVVKSTEIQWEKFDDRETEEKTTTRLDNKETEGLNVEEENDEMKKTIDNWTERHTPSLDFTAQKSRIALKNAHSRPPRNPRSLLNTPSLLPTPSELQQPEKLSVVPMVVKQGGPVISGFKLPGMGGGFPALKRTHRGVREGEGVTAECVYPKNSQAPDATKTLKSDREEVVGGKVVGMGVIGVKLPGFMGEFPGLRKTERGAKVREQTPEKNPPSQNNSTERSDRTGTDSITGVKQMGFGSGFTLLRKTERGVRIREGEDTQHSTQNSEVEVNIPGVDHQETLPKAKPKWTPPGKPGIGIDNPSMISELKNKLRKTE